MNLAVRSDFGCRALLDGEAPFYLCRATQIVAHSWFRRRFTANTMEASRVSTLDTFVETRHESIGPLRECLRVSTLAFGH